MNSSREELLFQLALMKPAEERAVFLDRECGEDKSLCQRLEALLAAHETPDDALAVAAPTARGTIKIEFADEPKDETVRQKIGRYKILEKVGEGGVAVWLCRRTNWCRSRRCLCRRRGSDHVWKPRGEALKPRNAKASYV